MLAALRLDRDSSSSDELRHRMSEPRNSHETALDNAMTELPANGERDALALALSSEGTGSLRAARKTRRSRELRRRVSRDYEALVEDSMR